MGYAVNELALGAVLVLVLPLGPLALPVWCALVGGACLAVWISLALERLRLRVHVPLVESPPMPEWERFTCTSHGLTLSCYASLPRAAGAPREGRKLCLLVAPLGTSGPTVFTPLIATLGDEWQIVGWDYRGFFHSGQPERKRRISIAAHAEDAAAVLEAVGHSAAALVVGHSMGVQVALELTVLFPERVERLVLLNGCPGHAFQTAFQPIARVPLLSTFAYELIRQLRQRPWIFDGSRRVLAPVLKHAAFPLLTRVRGSPLLKRLLGPTYLFDFWLTYMTGLDARRGRRELEHFLYSFLEIDAHSVAHLLELIEQPTLVISGLLDPLLPALVSAEMAAQMRRATHACDPLSAHTSLLESPEWALHHIHVFLRQTEGRALDLAKQRQRKSL